MTRTYIDPVRKFEIDNLKMRTERQLWLKDNVAIIQDEMVDRERISPRTAAMIDRFFTIRED